MNKKSYYYTYKAVNRYGKLFGNEIKVLDISFNNKRSAIKWLKEKGNVLADSIYKQFKDQWEYVSEFTLYLYKDHKVIRTFTIKEKKK